MFVSYHYCVIVVTVLKIHSDGQPSQPRLQWTFPQKTASLPASESQTASRLLMAIM